MKRIRLGLQLAAGFAAALVAIPLAVPSRAADDATETRSVASFNKIRLQGAFSTTVTAGADRKAVVVRGNGDDVARVTTEVRDETLIVGMRPGMGALRRSPHLEITLPVLRSFTNEGTGSATITGLAGGHVDIVNAGAASIVASGRAAREKIELNGTGKIDATGVDARDVTVDNNGVGSVRVRASGDLVMNVNGVGEIRYAGNPQHVESHVNGIGHIGRL